MNDKHLVWGSIVLLLLFWGEPDLLDSAISYITYASGGR